MSVRDRAALGLLAATGLPIIVAVTAIGVDQDMLDTGTAAALVGAGMLSVLLYPLIGMTLRGDRAEVVGPARAGRGCAGGAVTTASALLTAAVAALAGAPKEGLGEQRDSDGAGVASCVSARPGISECCC